MDLGVLKNMKRRYRRKLLRKLLLLVDSATHETPELGVIDFWKNLNLKYIMFSVARAYGYTKEGMLKVTIL